MFDKDSFLSEMTEVRKRKGITQMEMARRLNTSTAGVRSIEIGNPSLSRLADYLEVIGLDLNDIFVE